MKRKMGNCVDAWGQFAAFVIAAIAYGCIIIRIGEHYAP